MGNTTCKEAPIDTGQSSRSATPVILNGEDLTVRFGTQLVLDQVNLTIRTGDRVGLVGRNGAGKSTLLKVLAGVMDADSGSVTTAKGLARGYLAQEAVLDPQRSVAENIRAGATRAVELLEQYEIAAGDGDGRRLSQLEAEIEAVDAWNLDVRVAALSDALHAPAAERLVGTLSGGEKRRVGLARALVAAPPLLLLDEPTNHLDIPAIEGLEQWLANWRQTLILITHDRRLLQKVCTRVFEVNNGELHCYEGSYDRFLRLRAERLAAAQLKEDRRLSFLRRELDWVQRGPKARTTKAKARLERYHDAASQEALKHEDDVELVIPPAGKLGNRILELDQLAMSRDGRTLIRELTLEVTHGARIGVVGPNGCGKTTLLKLIMGELTPSGGGIRTGTLTQFNYIGQDRSQLDSEHTVFEEVGEGLDYVMLGGQRVTLWAYLKRFLFADERIRTVIRELSGGERNRVLLAKQIKAGGNFLILDEPTNDLDLATLRVLEEALMAFTGVALIVSHDRYFLNRVCTAILSFGGDGTLSYEPGDYDDWLARQSAQATTTTAAKPEKKAPEKKGKRLSWKEARELEGMESTILEAEAEIERLETLFAEPDFYEKHGAEATTLAADLEQAKQNVAALYDRWQELEAIRDGDSGSN